MTPLVPAEADLRDFPYMPVDIGRLFGSSFHARASDAAWRAGVTLWLKSFHQVPAASLPDDDVELARLAEMGRDVKGWRKVRAEALHGWQTGDDGRLYHLVVAEKALEAWIEKLGQRKSSGTANAKRWGGEFDAAAIDGQISNAVGMLTALNPHSRALRRRMPKPAAGTPGGTPDGIPSASQERGIEKGKGREERKSPAQHSTSSGDGCAAPSLEMALREAADVLDSQASGLTDTAPIERLIAEGVSLDGVILPALKAVAKAGRKGNSWAYYLGPIRDRKSGGASRPEPARLASVWVLRHSEGGRAWDAYEEARGGAVRWLPSTQHGEGRSLASAWPPGHPKAAEAAA